MALDLGADDYVEKPFALPELLARVRVGLRHAERTAGAVEESAVLARGPLRIDIAERRVDPARRAARADADAVRPARVLRAASGPAPDAPRDRGRGLGRPRRRRRPEPARLRQPAATPGRGRPAPPAADRDRYRRGLPVPALAIRPDDTCGCRCRSRRGAASWNAAWSVTSSLASAPNPARNPSQPVRPVCGGSIDGRPAGRNRPSRPLHTAGRGLHVPRAMRRSYGASMAPTPRSVKRTLVGRRMPMGSLEDELLPRWIALPIFASDPLSSVAYATEAALVVLVAASRDLPRSDRADLGRHRGVARDRRPLVPPDDLRLPQRAAARTSSRRRTSARPRGSSLPRRCSPTTC